MTKLICHAVFNSVVFNSWCYLKRKQGYSLIKVFDFCSIGSQCPIFHKIGSASGVQNLKIRGARGVPFMEDNPRDWIILAKNSGCLLFMLFGSS